MTDYQNFKYAGVEFPLASATTNTLLQDADPALFQALDFFESVLNHHLGARLTAQAALAGITWPTAVGYKLPCDPGLVLLEEQVRFPLLAVYRVNEQVNERTRAFVHSIGEWKICYVLQPLDAAQFEQLWPALKAASNVIIQRTENQFDPSYQSGANVWRAAGLEQIRVKEVSYGTWEASDRLHFPSVILTLEVKEIEQFTSTGFEAYAGSDNTETVDTVDVVDFKVP